MDEGVCSVMSIDSKVTPKMRPAVAASGIFAARCSRKASGAADLMRARSATLAEETLKSMLTVGTASWATEASLAWKASRSNEERSAAMVASRSTTVCGGSGGGEAGGGTVGGGGEGSGGVGDGGGGEAVGGGDG